MSENPLVTNEDRQRGWAELEIELTDGSRECVRVHALQPADVIFLAALSPVAALREGLALTLRADATFVARITPECQLAIMATQSLLIFGDWPASAVAMRDCIAECAASVAPFKAALHGLMQSSKIPPLPKL